MDRIVLVLSALVCNALLGGPRSLYIKLGLASLARLPMSGVREIERRLNRANRSLQARRVRGWIVAVFVVFTCIVFGLLLEWILEDWPWAEMLLLAVLLPFRSTWDCAAAIGKGLRAHDLQAARRPLENTVWKHYALLDDHGLARAAVEMLAVHFSEKIVAPALAYLLFGLPGLLISKMIYLMQETLARPTESEQAFARASRVLHHYLHYIPSRITAMLWLAACIFIPSATMAEAAEEVISGMFGESPQDMALLSAAAVLRLSLGGPASAYVHEGWIGGGTAQATAADIRRAMRAFILVLLLFFCFVGVFI